MPFLLVIAGLFIALQAVVGFLFGQLFAGHLSVAASLTGCAGLVSALIAFKLASSERWTAGWARWTPLLALLGVALDVADYYLHLNIPGNYYPWFLVGPFVGALVLVAATAWRRR